MKTFKELREKVVSQQQQKPMGEAVNRRTFGKLEGVWKDSVSKNIIEFDENGMGFVVEDKRGNIHTFEYKNMNVLNESEG